MPTTSSAPERAGRAPDYIGVGDIGAAPAWWHAALLAHPQVRRARRDDGTPHPFGDFCERELGDADVAAYHARFARGADEVSGEWCGRYMSDGWVPPLLRRAAPDARLLVMLGDPLELMRAEAARRRELLPPGDRLYLTDVASRMRYGAQLARLRRYFAEEQILVLQFERCREDPVGEYRRTLRFLGLDDAFVPRALRRRTLPLPARLRRIPPVPAATAPALWPQLEEALRDSLRPDAEALAASVRGFELGLWPSFAR